MSEFWGLMLGMLGIALTMVGVVIAMMFWVRSESNELRKEAKEDRKDLLQLSRNMENAIVGIQSEMNDFHRRLVDISKKVS